MFLLPAVRRLMQRLTVRSHIPEWKWCLCPRSWLRRFPEILKERFYFVLDWLDDTFRASPCGMSVRRKYSFRPELEGLTERIMPIATTWTGAMNTNWALAGNWTQGVPGPKDDATINTVTNAPVIMAGQAAACASITDNGGSSLTIQSTASLEITGQTKTNSVWNAPLTVNGVLEVDNPNNNMPGPAFQWIGGNIQGAQNGTNPWGIYVFGGATWDCWQKAQNLGVSMYVNVDQLHNQTSSTQSNLNISDAGAANQLQQELILNNNANITIAYAGLMDLAQATNSNQAGGIAVGNPGASTSEIIVQTGGNVTHEGDKNGKTLIIQPLVLLSGGTWVETGTNGPSAINFASQNSGGAVEIGGNTSGGLLSLKNGVTVIAGAGIAINANGTLSVVNLGGGGVAQATINGNIFDNFGGNISIGSGVLGFAALTVNGNVGIVNGSLSMWVAFDGNGNLSNYDRLNVFGEFAVNAEQGEWTSTLSITTLLTNNVQPVAGQIINIVTATTTNTANPPQGFTVFNYNGYVYKKEALTASGYQLTT